MLHHKSSGLQQNQTQEYEVEIFAFNSKGRSEMVNLPKITLNAEETIIALNTRKYNIWGKLYFYHSKPASFEYFELRADRVFKGFWLEWSNYKGGSGGENGFCQCKIFQLHCRLTEHGYQEIYDIIY